MSSNSGSGCIDMSMSKDRSLDTIHWLPARCTTTTATEFHVDEKNLNEIFGEGEGTEHSSATLRGRNMEGFRFVLPEGYVGMALHQSHHQNVQTFGQPEEEEKDDMDENRGAEALQSNTAPSAPGKSWAASQVFGSITLWGHDVPPSKSEPGRRCLDYLSVAKKAHAPISRDQVLQQIDLMKKAS